ncbi:hypothetical protein AAEX28_10380 [Lentisphaerota bacterium WC36G]|nr:hypothetical protein LJT99_13220 [Lentisphaerae bacterium WC36]
MIEFIFNKWLNKEQQYDEDVAVASNPANVEISILLMARDKWWLSLLIILSFLAVTVFIFIYKNGNIKEYYYCYLPTIIFYSWFSYYFSEKAEKFKKGNANPGIVISENPTQIAVSVELATQGGHYPAFKIIQDNSLKNARIGDKVSTVADYNGWVDNLHWNDVNPETVLSLSKNPEDEQRIMGTFKQEFWDFIEENKHHIPKDFETNGLYKIKSDFSDWD